MDLKDFQIKAIAELNAAMKVAGKRDVIFKSPTGSGKTIVLTSFMHEYMKDHQGIVFVWLTPGKGELEEQSKKKMDRYCHNASTKSLADVMTGGFAAGDAVFVNWEKLTKKGSNALKDSERTNFSEWIEKAKSSGVKFKVVVDESHQHFTEKSDAIVELFDTDKIIRASATPINDPSAILVEVDERDVIAEGLIKKVIEINPDFPAKVELGKVGTGAGYLLEKSYLLEKAVEKRNEIRMAFAARSLAVNPLIVVQLPNKSDALLEAVEEWFAERHIDCASGTLAVWLADRHDNLDGIEENDAKSEAVIIKQAVATGWDCPRAHILVKLREHMDETFEIQTIGRIRRMPQAQHYEDDVLDHCYLYTFDDAFTSGLRESLGGKALDAKKLFLKAEHRKFSLIKEQRTMVTDARDPLAALESVEAYMKKRYSLDNDGAKNLKRLEAAGYLFKDEIVRHAVSGSAVVLADVSSGELNAIEYTSAIDTHRHGREFHHVVGEVGAVCPLPYEDARSIVFRLFGVLQGDCGKILGLDAKRLYAFVINNEAKLKDDFSEAMAAELPLTVSRGNVSEKEFRFPGEWVMLFDSTLKVQTSRDKNVYKGYLASARPRSTGETKFEKWCEGAAPVDWWYRNGDKGDEYFSIVYNDNAGRQKLFYPDYVLSFGGVVWIVEVKGGFGKSGESENIDKFAPMKAAALKAYCKKYSICGAFVCYDADEDILLASEDGFSENKNDPCWKHIEQVLGL